MKIKSADALLQILAPDFHTISNKATEEAIDKQGHQY
jgi:hypothetical protein